MLSKILEFRFRNFLALFQNLISTRLFTMTNLTISPRQAPFLFRVPFIGKNFGRDPLATEGQVPLQGNPQVGHKTSVSSVSSSGNPGAPSGVGVQDTPGEVADPRHPKYPCLPPENQRPVAELAPKGEDQPAEQGRGGLSPRSGWFSSGGPLGRVLSITKVEVHEPPKPKDSQPFRGFEKPNPVVINLSSVGGETTW